MDLKKCIEYMKEKHGDQKRKQGTPYYTHPMAVSRMLEDKGFGEDYFVAGLFHDLLEDTDSTYEEIVSYSNQEVALAVKLVTKEKGYDMKDYIERIKNNDIARMVKIADRIHNLSEAIYGSLAFKQKYIKETEAYFIDLAKDTVFEKELNDVLESIKSVVKAETGVERRIKMKILDKLYVFNFILIPMFIYVLQKVMMLESETLVIIISTILVMLVCFEIIYTFVFLFGKIGMKYRRYKDFLDKDD